MKDRAMAIYLVQRGAAKAEAEDPQRSLTDGGKQTVERIGAHLVKCGVTLDRIEHSDKLRSRQTAEILATKLPPAHGTAQVPSLAPNDCRRARFSKTTPRWSFANSQTMRKNPKRKASMTLDSSRQVVEKAMTSARSTFGERHPSFRL